MIESFMLIAKKQWRTLYELKLLFIYRIHEDPKAEKKYRSLSIMLLASDPDLWNG